MDEKKDDQTQEEDTDAKEMLRSYFEQAKKDKKKPVAKDLVKLKHVETRKQEVSQETLDLARTLKEHLIKHDEFEHLTNEELTILEAFNGKRLFLRRIAIVVNQSRVVLGIEPLKKAELLKLLNGLIKKGYVIGEKVGDEIVYYLTERGKHRIQ